MLNLKPDPQQIVHYFSDFLTQINLIIHNIKISTYQMVEIVVPSPTLLTVYQSMASIISATHKTYDSLKRIEAVMAGVVKAKKMEPIPSPTTPINKYRSKSVQSDIFFDPRREWKNNHLKESNQFISLDSRTIKKSKIIENNNEEVPKISNYGNQIQLAKKSMKDLEEKQQDEKTIKLINQKAREQRQPNRPLKDWKKVISDRINALINSNHSGMSRIMDRNMECLRLVRSVKKEIKLQR